MKKLLLLSTAYTSLDLIRCAKKNNIYTVVTDYLEPDLSIAKQIADEYWMISTNDIDTLAEKCISEHIDGVVCGISPFNINMTIKLCEKVGLPCWWTEDSWHYSENKRDFKDLCIRNGVPVAKDYFISSAPTEEELSQIEFPVVVKAIDLCGNRGMSYCHSIEDIVVACEYARSLSSSDVVIVERMLKGREYTGQYVMADGEASLLNFNAMFSQPGYPENCYSITTTCVNPEHFKRFCEEVDPYFRKALKEAGCRDGVGNIEVFLDEDGHFYALEMGFRLSGDMFAHPMKTLTGFDSYKWMLEIALGIKHTKEDLPKSQSELPDRCGCSYILWSKEAGVLQNIQGIEEIASIPGVTIEIFQGISEKKYNDVIAITFCADTREQMYDIIRKINDTIIVTDENNRNMIIYFNDFESIEKECLTL